ncbi:MAG: hypothetical protein RL308_1435 [Bacteroidota bacterium]|jgi:hypothetical protein
MTRVLKLITVGGAAIIILLIGNLIVKSSIYGHSTDWELHRDYMWIFKDSIKNDIDTIGFSYVGKDNILNNFHYKSDIYNYDFGYNIIVWEFKNLKKINLKEISINNQFDLYNIQFEEGETLNKGTDLETDVKYGFSFDNGINLNVDESDSIISYYNGSNYKGCYGYFRQISLSNKKDGHQIIFHNYLDSALTSILIYKKGSSIFLIVIQSEKHFDDDIINLFNFNGNVPLRWISRSCAKYKNE